MSGMRFLERAEIEDEKWNALIDLSAQALPYPYTWYFDAVAEHWDALITDNYKACMPLVWLRKYGVKCLYQPYYCQQLGVFSREVAGKEEHRAFIKEAARKFPYININLNPSAALVDGMFNLTRKKNLLLRLDANYEKIKKGYSENQLRNIARAIREGLELAENIELKDFQKFYLTHVTNGKQYFKPKHQKIFRNLTSVLLLKQKGEIAAVENPDKKLLAASFLIHHGNRIINIINISAPEARRNGANHLLFDQIIKKISASGRVLDFEGSSLPGVARFYEGFGASEEVFFNFKDTILKNPGMRIG